MGGCPAAGSRGVPGNPCIMKIRLISVGRAEDDYIRIGAHHFLKQIRVFHPIEEIRIKGIKASTEREISKALDREAAKIQKTMDSRDRLFLMDRQGRVMTSKSFASFMAKNLNTPARSLTFVIGSAEGISESIRERADEILSLSRMTLTHDLSRLLLLEQIYRGFTILRGKRYHR